MNSHSLRNLLKTFSSRPDRVVSLGSAANLLAILVIFFVGGSFALQLREIDSYADIRSSLIRIGRLDEESTRSAMTAAMTGDSFWIARHDSAAAAMYQAIGILLNRERSAYLHEHLNQIRQVHGGLYALEKLAFARLAEGDRDEALRTVSSEAYNELADALTRELIAATESHNHFIRQQRDKLQNGLLLVGLVGLISAVLLLLLRQFTVRTVRSYIRERDETDASLIQAREAAEEASRAKSEFLSRTSHELRTPLNAILGFGQLLEMDLEKEENRDSLDHIMRAGRHLLALVDEVLDLAKIEAGELRLAVEDVVPEEAARAASALVQPMAAAHGIAIQIESTLDPGATVRADGPRLHQVLLNLLSNAIKYNVPGGSIYISGEPAGNDRVRIAVRDTGIGIPEEHLRRVFTPFHRAEAERHGIAGTGLGLSLSKGLIEAMGGTMSVESTVGVGSTFTVELPRGQAAPAAPVGLPEPVQEEERRLVLYIEDSVSNQRLIERILGQREGVELITAMQGALGLELARQHRPDLVLLDLDLPDLSGEEVLMQLHAEPALHTVPVVVLTAETSASVRKRLLGMGAHEYLTKPLDVPRLLEVLDEALQTAA